MQLRSIAVGIILMSTLTMLSATATAQGRRSAAPGKELPHPPKVGEKSPGFELKNLKGEVISLSRLTKKSPVVLLVLRGWPGYQCPICNRQVREFLSKKAEFADAQLVMIYPGPADLLAKHAKEFQGDKSFPSNYHYLIDPEYKFTTAWGLRWEAPRETAYPSTFVVDTNRKIIFGKTVVSHGDRANVSTVTEALKKAKK